MLDRDDLFTEMLKRGGLNDMPFPQDQRRRHGTPRAEAGGTVGDFHGPAGEAHRIVIAALPFHSARRAGVEGHADPLAQGAAYPGIVAQPHPLAAGVLGSWACRAARY